ncbi:MAG: hypothetical protein AAGF11_52365 [Myxococcota bacterium]
MNTPLDIVVVAEATSDARRAKGLVDRVIIEAVDWLKAQPDLLDSQRRWRGVDATCDYLDIHKVPGLARSMDLPPVRGGFEGKLPAEDHRVAVQAMWVLIALGPPQILIWIRDTDGSTERRRGWLDACRRSGAAFRGSIGGFPHECMEAWLLAAWSPTSADEHRELAKERARLGFSPIEQPQRLSHKQSVKRSIKGVCKTLGVDEGGLQTVCVDQLRRRGAGCGLAAFLMEIDRVLVSIIRSG